MKDSYDEILPEKEITPVVTPESKVEPVIEPE
jgi:hypothetical protein